MTVDRLLYLVALVLGIIVMLIWLGVLPSFAAQVGTASWYGPGFHGRTTASGERFNQNAMTCAHRTARFGTMLRVTDLRTGKTITCRVNDRGPFTGGRVIDLSKAAATRLGMIRRGTAKVRVQQ